jgi:hypothetical protein
MLAATWTYQNPQDGQAVGGDYTALLNWGNPVDATGLPVTIEGLIAFTVAELESSVPRDRRFKVGTKAYYYTVRRAEDDGEIILFHWHPSGGHVTYPHVHIGSAELSRNGLLSGKSHMPSGRIAFEQVLIMLHDLGAEPGQSDWEAVLDRNLKTFVDWRSWH